MNDTPSNSRRARSPNELIAFFTERANTGDLDGLVALYEPDAVIAAGAPVASGHDDIRSFYARVLARRSSFPAGEPMEPIFNGDLALTITRLPKGRLSVEVARRQADGSWLWVIDQLKLELPDALAPRPEVTTLSE